MKQDIDSIYGSMCKIVAIGFIFLGLMISIHQPVLSQHIQRKKVSLSAGTTGIVGEYGYSISKKFDLNFEGGYMHFQRTFGFVVRNEDVYVRPKLDFGQAGVRMDFYPFAKVDSNSSSIPHFRLSMGLYLRTSGTYSGRVRTDAINQINDFTLTNEQIGYIQVDMKTSHILPYAGLGYDIRPGKKSRMAFGLDAGIFYHGKPDVVMIGTGLYNQISENEAQMQKNLSDLRWYPLLKFGFRYFIAK